MLTANTKGRHTQDWFNLGLAVLLFLSPWLLGFMGDIRPARNAMIIGVMLAVLAVAALSTFAEWEEWLNLALGLWLMASPWLLGFTGNYYAFWTHLILGVLTGGASAWAVWDYHHEPHPAA